MKYLESIVPFDPVFPYTLIVGCQFSIVHQILRYLFRNQGDGTEYNYLLRNAAFLDKQPLVYPKPVFVSESNGN